jgi:hypothetical protein
MAKKTGRHRAKLKNKHMKDRARKAGLMRTNQKGGRLKRVQSKEMRIRPTT